MIRLRRSLGIVLAGSLTLAACEDEAPQADGAAQADAPAKRAEAQERAASETDPLMERARRLARRVVILDGHIDVPYRLEMSKGQDGAPTEDVTHATDRGDFDLPRARAGGLDAPFMSIYVPPKYEEVGGARALADGLIDMVEGIPKRAPEDFALAHSTADVRNNFAQGKISLALGMENGAPLEGSLANLAHFHARGIRYITLAHSRDNHISDSSYDDRHSNGGLSSFGKQVVAEMNRLGVMIDVSHLSDDAFWQVMELSEAPVIASHTSCRTFTPGWERNMDDDMIKALAKNGGVIQIAFGSMFIDDAARTRLEALHKEFLAVLAAEKLEFGTPAAYARRKAWSKDHPAPRATVQQVADHIEHVISLVGADHVGFGSDFDGVAGAVPEGLEDVSMYPNLIRELLSRGYPESDITKIAGENVLRVWERVEAHARDTATKPAAAVNG